MDLSWMRNRKATVAGGDAAARLEEMTDERLEHVTGGNGCPSGCHQPTRPTRPTKPKFD